MALLFIMVGFGEGEGDAFPPDDEFAMMLGVELGAENAGPTDANGSN
jgi:hypothetical protein